MNHKFVLKILGYVLIFEGLAMVPPALASMYYSNGGDVVAAFAVSAAVLFVIGAVLARQKPKTAAIYSKDGFAIVAFSWISISLFGALPFYLSGKVGSLVDCVFESASGFTTTGATILTELSGFPEGLVLWRGLMNWLGGMGVLVLLVAVLPSMGARTSHIVKAEAPGPSMGRFLPKMSDTAKMTYLIYVSLTAVMLICLLVTGMPMFDSLVHSLSTAGTGGFSSLNHGLSGYANPAAEVVVTVFMLLFGVNFMLYYMTLTGNVKRALKSEELRLYLLLFAGAVAIITVDITSFYSGNFLVALRLSVFQTASVISTTGFASANYDLWPDLSKMILLVLMLVGSCANSTGGAVKQIRVLILIKSVRNHIKHIVHPRAVSQITIDGKNVDDGTVREVQIFFFAYVFILFVTCLIISFDSMDIFSTFSAAVASISNIGPSFGQVGPMLNYSALTALSKITLTICMLLGRLEIFPLIVILAPSVWSKKSL